MFCILQAILCYWFTANFFSMIQVTFLKTPRIRRFFDLPVAVKHKQPEKQTKKSFTEGFRDSKYLQQVNAWSSSISKTIFTTC